MGMENRPAAAMATTPATTIAAWTGSAWPEAADRRDEAAVIGVRLPVLRQPDHHAGGHGLAVSACAGTGLDVAGVEEAGLAQHLARGAVVGEVAGPHHVAAPVPLGPAQGARHRLGSVADR